MTYGNSFKSSKFFYFLFGKSQPLFDLWSKYLFIVLKL